MKGEKKPYSSTLKAFLAQHNYFSDKFQWFLFCCCTKLTSKLERKANILNHSELFIEILTHTHRNVIRDVTKTNSKCSCQLCNGITFD